MDNCNALISRLEACFESMLIREELEQTVITDWATYTFHAQRSHSVDLLEECEQQLAGALSHGILSHAVAHFSEFEPLFDRDIIVLYQRVHKHRGKRGLHDQIKRIDQVCILLIYLYVWRGLEQLRRVPYHHSLWKNGIVYETFTRDNGQLMLVTAFVCYKAYLVETYCSCRRIGEVTMDDLRLANLKMDSGQWKWDKYNYIRSHLRVFEHSGPIHLITAPEPTTMEAPLEYVEQIKIETDPTKDILLQYIDGNHKLQLAMELFQYDHLFSYWMILGDLNDPDLEDKLTDIEKQSNDLIVLKQPDLPNVKSYFEQFREFAKERCKEDNLLCEAASLWDLVDKAYAMSKSPIHHLFVFYANLDAWWKAKIQKEVGRDTDSEWSKVEWTDVDQMSISQPVAEPETCGGWQDEMQMSQDPTLTLPKIKQVCSGHEEYVQVKLGRDGATEYVVVNK